MPCCATRLCPLWVPVPSWISYPRPYYRHPRERREVLLGPNYVRPFCTALIVVVWAVFLSIMYQLPRRLEEQMVRVTFNVEATEAGPFMVTWEYPNGVMHSRLCTASTDGCSVDRDGSFQGFVLSDGSDSLIVVGAVPFGLGLDISSGTAVAWIALSFVFVILLILLFNAPIILCCDKPGWQVKRRFSLRGPPLPEELMWYSQITAVIKPLLALRQLPSWQVHVTMRWDLMITTLTALLKDMHRLPAVTVAGRVFNELNQADRFTCVFGFSLRLADLTPVPTVATASQTGEVVQNLCRLLLSATTSTLDVSATQAAALKYLQSTEAVPDWLPVVTVLSDKPDDVVGDEIPGPEIGVQASAEDVARQYVASQLCALGSGSQWRGASEALWVRFTLRAAAEVTAYAIVPSCSVVSRDPSDWSLLGSPDNATWTLLDQRRDIQFRSRAEALCFKVAAPGRYQHYELRITRMQDKSAQVCEIQRVRLFRGQLIHASHMLATATAIPQVPLQECFAIPRNVLRVQARETEYGNDPSQLLSIEDALHTAFVCEMVAVGATISVEVLEAHAPVVRYDLLSAPDWPERDPSSWILEGSNDQQAWVLLDTQNFVRFERSTIYSFLLPAHAANRAFAFYKLSVCSVVAAANAQLSGLRLCTAVPTAESASPVPEGAVASRVPPDEAECIIPAFELKATARGEQSFRWASNLLDARSGTTWQDLCVSSWVLLEWYSPVTPVVSYGLVAGNMDANHNPRHWSFDGSQDQASWITLDSQRDQVFSLSEFKRYPIAAPYRDVPYRFYRLRIIAVHGMFAQQVTLACLNLYTCSV